MLQRIGGGGAVKSTTLRHIIQRVGISQTGSSPMKTLKRCYALTSFLRCAGENPLVMVTYMRFLPTRCAWIDCWMGYWPRTPPHKAGTTETTTSTRHTRYICNSAHVLQEQNSEESLTSHLCTLDNASPNTSVRPQAINVVA